MPHIRFVVVVLGLLLTQTATVQGEETTGRITQLMPDKNMLVLTDPNDETPYTFQPDENTQIQINGRTASFAELQVGDRLTVTWEWLEDVEVNIPSVILCQRR